MLLSIHYKTGQKFTKTYIVPRTFYYLAHPRMSKAPSRSQGSLLYTQSPAQCTLSVRITTDPTMAKTELLCPENVGA